MIPFLLGQIHDAKKKKKTIPLPGGAELVKLAMSTNTGSVQPTGSATVLRATVMEVYY